MPELGLEALLLLAVSAFLAGAVDAVVGGGGLIQLPALMLAFPTATPVQLLATNKVGSIAGTSIASITYYRRVKPDLRTALPLAVSAFAGSAATTQRRTTPSSITSIPNQSPRPGTPSSVSRVRATS